MTVDDKSVDDGEHGRLIAEDLTEAGAGPSRLDRRHLLGGMAAGAAGLLLPRHATAGFGIRGIRFTIANKEWSDAVLTFKIHVQTDSFLDQWEWKERSRSTLTAGTTASVQTAGAGKGETDALINLHALALPSGSYNFRAKNPNVGTPWMTGYYSPGELRMKWELKDNAREWWVNSNYGIDDVILIERRKDTSDFKEFSIELRRGKQVVQHVKDQNDKDDKQDKKDSKNEKDTKDNDTRQRKRGGASGGSGDVDRRKRPADQLLD